MTERTSCGVLADLQVARDRSNVRRRDEPSAFKASVGDDILEDRPRDRPGHAASLASCDRDRERGAGSVIGASHILVLGSHVVLNSRDAFRARVLRNRRLTRALTLTRWSDDIPYRHSRS